MQWTWETGEGILVITERNRNSILIATILAIQKWPRWHTKLGYMTRRWPIRWKTEPWHRIPITTGTKKLTSKDSTTNKMTIKGYVAFSKVYHFSKKHWVFIHTYTMCTPAHVTHGICYITLHNTPQYTDSHPDVDQEQVTSSWRWWSQKRLKWSRQLLPLPWHQTHQMNRVISWDQLSRNRLSWDQLSRDQLFCFTAGEGPVAAVSVGRKSI